MERRPRKFCFEGKCNSLLSSIFLSENLWFFRAGPHAVSYPAMYCVRKGKNTAWLTQENSDGFKRTIRTRTNQIAPFARRTTVALDLVTAGSTTDGTVTAACLYPALRLDKLYAALIRCLVLWTVTKQFLVFRVLKDCIF